MVVQHHLAFGQIEIERSPLQPGSEQCAESCIQMQQRYAEVVVGVLGRLDLLVGHPRGTAHQSAAEAMAGLAAGAVDPHFHEQTAAVFVRPQTAPAVGQSLRQHRHDAIGEVDAVAARFRRAIESRTGPHVMRDVGDGDDQAKAAGLVWIGFGEHRVVEVARIGAVDRYQLDVAQVGAAAQRHPARA